MASAKPLFAQNVIAVVWDFDKTLSPGYMQGPLFDHYKVEEATFWAEVNALPGALRRTGDSTPLGAFRVNEENIYLNTILGYVRQGIFRDLTNAKLRELGGRIKFFPGMPEALTRLKDHVGANPSYQQFDIQLEHYVVSTGLREMIVGSGIGSLVDGIWGCEFAEAGPTPGNPQLALSSSDTIAQVAYSIDNTSKTRAIFEINKGSNKRPKDIDVNSYMRAEDRRIPIENMIYVADGPSDIPVFSVVAAGGGRTFGVYPKGVVAAFRQVNQLQIQGRVHAIGEADYSAGSHTSLWLEAEIDRIGERMVELRQRQFSEQVGRPARHLPLPVKAGPPEERLGASALVPAGAKTSNAADVEPKLPNGGATPTAETVRAGFIAARTTDPEPSILTEPMDPSRRTPRRSRKATTK